MAEMRVVVVERMRDRAVGERRRTRRHLGASDDRRDRLATLVDDVVAYDTAQGLAGPGLRDDKPVEEREARHRAGALRDRRGIEGCEIEQPVHGGGI